MSEEQKNPALPQQVEVDELRTVEALEARTLGTADSDEGDRGSGLMVISVPGSV